MKLIKQINWSLVELWPLPSTTLCWIFRHLCSSRFIFHSLVAGCDGAIGCISISRYRSVPPGHLVPGVEAERWQVPSNIVETRGHQGGSGRKKVATPSLLPWPEPLSWLSTNIKGAGMEGDAGNFDNGHYNLAWTFGEYLSQRIEPLKRDYLISTRGWNIYL